MKIKEQTCVIVSSYPQTAIDNSLLGLTLKSWTDNGYTTLLTSHSPVTQDIQKEVKYFIYSDENDMLEYKNYSNLSWHHTTSELRYCTNWGNTMGKHSFAILQNIKNALQLLSIKGYTHFIFIDDDTFLTDKDHLILEDKLNEIDFLSKDYFFYIESNHPSIVPVSTLFGGNISYFLDKVSQIKTPSEYLDYCNDMGGFSLENYLGKAFIIEGDSNGNIEDYPLRNVFINDWIGASQSGEVRVPGLKNYDFWLDLVRSRENDDVIYFIVSESSFNIEGELVIYIDGNEVNRMNITTGPLHWFLTETKKGDQWKLEFRINNKIVKQVEYSVQQILDNPFSFLEFY